jgi:hypothetical protein
VNEADLMAAGISPPIAKSVALSIMEDRARREASRRPSVNVRIYRLSTGDLDSGNLENSPKALVDCLRDSRVIEDDDQEHITLEVIPVKVKTRKEQGTLVEIEYAV